MSLGPSSRLKTLSLVVLIAQTTALVLFLRHSRTKNADGPKYISSTAVFVSEIVKMITCLAVLAHECSKFYYIYFDMCFSDWCISTFVSEIKFNVFQRPADFFKMSVPAVLYVIQNNLLFVALSKLDAATYQVTYQLKILTTAIFTVAIMHRTLRSTQWIALVLLTAGVALIQLPIGNAEPRISGDSSDRFIGFLCVVAACCTSGFAGVYLEKIAKNGTMKLFMISMQLTFFSIFGSLFTCWIYDWQAISKDGFLQGYNTNVWIVVFLQAWGGLVVGFVIKYADNILKGIALSLSIILSSFVSWAFLGDFTPNLAFVAGSSLVLGSTFLYGYQPKTHSS